MMREVEILGRVDAGDAGGLQLRLVLGRNDAADDDRQMAEAGLLQTRQHLFDQREWEPERMERPTTWAPSLAAASAICWGVRRMPS